MNWERSIKNNAGEPTLLIHTLFKRWGRHVDLHKMVRADDPGCFHTHPAYAYRIVLWGGYCEQVLTAQDEIYWRDVYPGTIELIEPWYCHRIHSLFNGRSSYSLWLRGPVVAEIQLRGWGWSEDAKPAPHAGKD